MHELKSIEQMTGTKINESHDYGSVSDCNTSRGLWEGMIHVAEDVKSDVVKAALDTEIITTEAKLVSVAKSMIERLFGESPSGIAFGFHRSME